MAWHVADKTTIYREAGWYAAHPNVVRTPGGDLMVLFRRCPDLRCSHHAHPLFDVRACRSRNEGGSWSAPALAVSNPRGGMGDFGTHSLPDGSMYLHGSSLELVPEEAVDARAPWQGPAEHGDLLPTAENERRSDYNRWKVLYGPPLSAHSLDDGHTWSTPRPLEPLPDAVYGHPAAHCGASRSGLLALADGRLLMPGKATDRPDGGQPYFGMLRVSADAGRHWTYGGRIAEGPEIHFSEPAIHQTPAGRILVIFRCHLPRAAGEPFRQPRLAVVGSDDGGRNWSAVHVTAIEGSPAHMLPLSDGRILLTYGTRWTGQQGCCARVLEPEGRDLETAEVIRVRSDSYGFPDCGYPWSAQLRDGAVLVVHYHVYSDHVRGIEGTILRESKEPA